MELTLTLDVTEIDVILDILGELPTKSNVYPLGMKIRQQAEAQISENKSSNPDDNPQE